MDMPDKIYNVSQTQFSLARHYGAININGVKYIYNPIDDSLFKAIDQKKRKSKKDVKK